MPRLNAPVISDADWYRWTCRIHGFKRGAVSGGLGGAVSGVLAATGLLVITSENPEATAMSVPPLAETAMVMAVSGGVGALAGAFAGACLGFVLSTQAGPRLTATIATPSALIIGGVAVMPFILLSHLSGMGTTWTRILLEAITASAAPAIAGALVATWHFTRGSRTNLPPA